MTTSFERSPQRWLRLGGALCLAFIVLGLSGLSGEVLVRGSLVVPGHAQATFEAIRQSPLLLLERAADPGRLTAGQQDALSFLAIQAHGYGFAIGLVFFGLACIVRGHLIIRSTCLPRWLGVLLPAFIGELALSLWLMARGVNLQRWKP